MALEVMGKHRKLDNVGPQGSLPAAFYCWEETPTEPLTSVSKSYSDPDLPSATPRFRPFHSLLPQLEQQTVGGDERQRASKPEHRRSLDCLPLATGGSCLNSPGAGSPTRLRKVASCATTAREKARKRVKFADEEGQQLCRVRLITEPSCVPPKLSFGAHRPLLNDDSSEESPDSNCHFKCQFAQPSSKYVMFRESLERNCVSLSNVYFDNCTIKGSIVVKNISFRKRVFLRVTFNDWRSHVDYDAVYGSSQDSQLDNFVFSFTCPSDHEGGVQFCVGYQCEAGEFWDSNGGANYRIAHQRRRPKEPFTRDFKPNFGCVSDFAEFSSWQHFSDSVYY